MITGSDKQKFSIFSYPLFLSYVSGAQKNRIEMGFFSTHNIYFGWEIRKLYFCYALLTKGLNIMHKL